MKIPRVLVVGLGGSLAEHSHSLSALRIALEGAADSGAETDLFDLRVLDLPFYRPDARQTPEIAVRMADRIHSAQAMLWSSPMYHGSISGAFKNALDWLQLLARRDPPYLTDKVIGLIATAGGTQGLQAVNAMEFIVRSLRGLAIPLVVPVTHARQSFDADGVLRDESVRAQLRALGAEVNRVAGTFSHGIELQKECERARERMSEIGSK